jgi:hypothetical protein
MHGSIIKALFERLYFLYFFGVAGVWPGRDSAGGEASILWQIA